MRHLREASPIWHAMAWIGIYIVVVNVGDALSSVVGAENAVTAMLLLALSVVAVVYLRTNRWLEHYGLRPMRAADFTRTLYYLPLLVIGLLQFLKGPKEGLDMQSILLVVVLMLGVGFLEELIFRGFLYRALRTRHGVVAAVLISGVTFGVGHVVNLARGYTGAEQVLQIVIGVALGIVLALLFAVTGTIVPGVVFHVLLNISGSVTANDQRLETYVVAASVLICAAYLPYLLRELRKQTRHDSPEPATTAASPESHRPTGA